MPDAPIPITPLSAVTPAPGGYTAAFRALLALAALPPDGTIKALVLRQDAAGNTLLRLPDIPGGGDITVRSAAPLPAGASLVLKTLAPYTPKLTADASPAPHYFQAKIVSVNGQPPDIKVTFPPAAASSGLQQTTVQEFPPPGVVRAAVPLPQAHAQQAQGQQVQGQQTQSSQTQQLFPNIAQQSALVQEEAAIINISGGKILQALAVTPGADLSPYLPSAGAADKVGSQQSFQQPFILRPADAVTVRVLAPQLVSVAPGAAPPLTGTVMGAEQSGEILIRTPVGMLKLPAEIALPKGAELALEIISVTRAEIHPETARTEKTSPYLDIFRQLHATLQAIDRETGSALTQQLFPAAAKQNAAKLIWFLGSVQRGDADLWLAPDVRRALAQSSQNDLLSSLKRTFAQFQQQAAQPGPGNWHSMMLPFLDGQQIAFAQMFVHRDGGRKSKDRQEGSRKEDVRFLVEATVSPYGEMQFDGFVKEPHTDNRRRHFDLVIRTHADMPVETQRDIRDIFSGMAEASGMAGMLQFHVAAAFPVCPGENLPPPPSSHPDIVA